MVIKGQALADFIAEFTYADTTEVAGMENNAEVAQVVEIRNSEASAIKQEDGYQ